MNWLGGLSNIKGQLSNLTRDLLTEGDVELIDPKHRLELAQHRIEELQTLVDVQKTEIGTLKVKNAELEAQLESTQLRLDHAREQFSNQLAEKEALIQKLRFDMTVERGEPEGQSSLTSKSHSPDEHCSVVEEAFSRELASQEHRTPDSDLGDGTATWLELRNEVADLRASVVKWRRIAKQRKIKDSKSTNEPCTLVTELEKEIEELKQRLSETEETRQAEVATLQLGHEQHLNDLYGQLRDTETEVLSLRSQLEQVNLQTQSPTPLNTQLSVDTTADDKSTTVRKQSRGKKRRLKGSADKRQSPTNSPLRIDGEQTYVVPRECEDVSTQTDLIDHSMESSSEYEKVDYPIRRSPLVHMEQQTFPETVCTAIQVDLLVASDSVISCDVTRNSVAVQTVSSHPSLKCLLELDQTSQFVVSDDHTSVRSDMSDISSYSRQLDDLVHQLAEELQTYENVVNQVVSTAVDRSLPTHLLSDLTEADMLHQLPSEKHTTQPDQEIEIAQQLALFQASLKSRRERIAALRRANRRKSLKARQYITGSTEYVCTSTSSAVIPCLNTAMPPTGANFTEADVESWHDDDFPVLQTKIAKSPAKALSDAPVVVQVPGETKSKIVQRSVSSETLVCDLQNAVHELESRLVEETHTHEDRIAELKASNLAFDRLKSTLHAAAVRIASQLSLSVATHLPDTVTTHWPPIEPDAQLALLIHAQVSDHDELQQARAKLDEMQQAFKIAQSKNECTEGVTQTTEQSHEENVIDDAVVPLAQQLCMALDSEYTEVNWDPEQWDVLLYDILKPRFTESALSFADQPTDDRVVQLLSEVTALRDVLSQHEAFHAQASNDLHHLMSVVATQREQLQSLTDENEHLKKELAQNLQPVDIHQAGDIELDETTQTTTQHLSETIRSKDEEVCTLVHRCEQMEQAIRSFCERVEPSPSDALLSEHNMANLDQWLDCLSTSWFELKTRCAQSESMCESVVSALKQKHSESQTYHTELQRVYAELVASEQHKRGLQEKVDELHQKLDQFQNKVHLQPTNFMEPLGTHRLKCTVDDTQSHLLPDETRTVESSVSVSESQPSTNEAVLLAELNRLRSHLLEMEETYTTEAINAETREVHLRDQLKAVESRLHQLEEVGQHADNRLLRAHAERDEAQTRAEEFRKEVAALRLSLSNLQFVLDSFQQNQQSAIAEETEHLRLEMQRLQRSETDTRTRLEQLQCELKARTEQEERAKDLEMQLRRYESQFGRIKDELEQRDAHIDSLRTRLAQMAVDTDSKIDKVLMKNVLLSYLQLPVSQRSSGLRVVGSLLQFSDEDYGKVDSNHGPLPRLFGWIRNAASVLPPGPPKDITFSSAYPNKSFTDLLIAFLEQESQPRPPLRLSMEYYTADAVRPRQHVSPDPSVNANVPVSAVQLPHFERSSATSEAPHSSILNPSTTIAHTPANVTSPVLKNPLLIL